MSVTTKESFVDAYLALLDEKDITKMSSDKAKKLFYSLFESGGRG